MQRNLIAKCMMLGLLLLMASLAGATPPQAADNTRSPHGNLNMPCQNCHTVYGWKPIRAVPEFDHNQTKFPLRGLHEGVSCTSCHTKMVFTNVGNKCADCHADIHRGKMSGACENCHTVRGWKVSVSQINMHMNRFPLTGAHAAAACENCHKSGGLSAFTTMSTECISCHRADFNAAANPKHTNLAVFDQPCETCHSTDTWLNAKFTDHSFFPLTGGHSMPPLTCVDCHKNNNYNLGPACIGCHQTDYNSTTNPAHAQMPQAFPSTCENCHTTVAWVPAQFPNHATTGFPLTGAHTVPPRACTDCHVNNNYNITDTTCVSCHQTDYNNAKTPVDHITANFPTACANCHDTVAWTDGKFDHASTGWALTGSHTVPPRLCTDCHVNGNYNITATTCVSCHQTDYNNTNNPSHAQQGIGTTCELCHNTSAWSPAQFDHSASGFPLTGAHTVPPRACTDCHINNNYNITNTACVSCHQTDYNNAKTPVDHITANFPTACANCHDTVAWVDGKFDHSSTGWILTGSHTVPPRLCTDCHVNGNYNITVTTCVSCHQTDYTNALTPVNHPQANFPLTCDTCHDTVVWTDGKFDHSSTGWTLTGSHTVPPRLCSDCHTSSVGYNITATTCVSCHQTDYNNATTPVNHITAKFPLTCDSCHDTIQWTDGTFNHTATGFTLTGSHTVPPRQCVDCHTATAGYNITVTTCVSCHQADYNTATTPVNHITANFPLTCDTCHDTIQWTDGTFNHAATGFALVGMHTVPPRACTDCHNATFGNYNIASAACVNCHQTDYNNTNAPPHATSGFPTTCDTCHDTVAWTDATFNHNNTAFPLTGFHTTVACATCHVNNNYTTLPTDCYGCHAADYNGTTNPVHSTAGFPTTCATCHTTTAWTGATFNHTYFPMTHGGAGGVCATCHTNPNDYTVFQCTGCHGNNNSANFQHPNVGGYVYNSINCYQCHKNGSGG